MNDTNAPTTAAHSATTTASFNSATLSVNTSAELDTMASTSKAVSSNEPGLRFPRRARTPRVGSVMGRLYL
ncbi:hypothetical protein JCM12141A_22510 [Mycolicibacterium hodleri]